MRVYAIAGVVVPDNLGTGLRNRERKGSVAEVGDAVTAVDQFGLTGSCLDLIVDRLRVTDSTLALVDRHTEGFRITLEHGDLTRGQIVLVLLVVLSGDHELRLLTSEGVLVEVIFQFLTGIARQATSPFRNGPRSITGLLCTDRCQGSTQLIDFSLGQGLRHYRGCHQAQGQTADTHQSLLHTHIVISPYGLSDQKLTLKLTAAKSRSTAVLYLPSKKLV